MYVKLAQNRVPLREQQSSFYTPTRRVPWHTSCPITRQTIARHTLHEPTVMSVNRRLNLPCPYGVASSLSSCCQRLYPGERAIRRNLNLQVTFCPLISLGITVAPRPSFSVVSVPNLLNSDSSEVMLTLARTVLIFGGDCSEL